MTALEELAFAELALLASDPQTHGVWTAIEHLRRARRQLVRAEVRLVAPAEKA